MKHEQTAIDKARSHHEHQKNPHLALEKSIIFFLRGGGGGGEGGPQKCIEKKALFIRKRFSLPYNVVNIIIIRVLLSSLVLEMTRTSFRDDKN